jgi:small GTP-binding protein
MSRHFFPATYKVVVVGSSSVGKSSMVQRLIQNTFTEDGSTTCGADFYTYSCPVNSENAKLQIWDTAGQERFRSIAKSYFRNAVGAVLVYDITNMSSFDELSEWLNDLHLLAAPNAYILLVGNKSDLEKDRQVGVDLIKDFVTQHHLEALETSALSGNNVMEAFARLALEVSTIVTNGTISVSQSPNRNSEPAPFVEERKKKQGKCCN